MATVAPAETVDERRRELLGRLTEGTRRVAVLALYGLNAREIQYVLALQPPAFRQRLSALRRALGSLPEPLRREALALAYSQPRRAGETRLDFGLIRRALLHHLRGGDGIGTHDPDGHLLAIRER
jgi:RNA polymerase sigma-70 factor (ECF subfamily)